MLQVWSCTHDMHVLRSVAKQPNLKLKTLPKQVLGSLVQMSRFPELVNEKLEEKDGIDGFSYHTQKSSQRIIIQINN